MKTQPKSSNSKQSIPITNRYCADLMNTAQTSKEDIAKPVSKYKIPPKKPSPMTKETKDIVNESAGNDKDKTEMKREEDIFGSELAKSGNPMASSSVSALEKMFNEIKTEPLNKKLQINGNEDGDGNEVFEDNKNEELDQQHFNKSQQEHEEKQKDEVENISNVDLMFEITENINTVQTISEGNINQQIESEKDNEEEKDNDKDKDNKYDHINSNNEHEHEHQNEHGEIQSSPKTTESKEIISSEADKGKEDIKEVNGNENQNENDNEFKNKIIFEEKEKENSFNININKNNSQELIDHIPKPKVNYPFYSIDQSKEVKESTMEYYAVTKELNELKVTISALKAQNKSLEHEVELYKNEAKEQRPIINQLKRRELIEGENVLRKQIEMLTNENETKERINKALMEENKRLNKCIEVFKTLAQDISNQSKDNENDNDNYLIKGHLELNSLHNINSYEETFQQEMNSIDRMNDGNNDNGEKGPNALSNQDIKNESNANVYYDKNDSKHDNNVLTINSNQHYQVDRFAKDSKIEEESSSLLNKPKESLANKADVEKTTGNLFDINSEENIDVFSNLKNKSVIISQKETELFSNTNSNPDQKTKESQNNAIIKPPIKTIKPLMKKKLNNQAKQIPQTHFNNDEEQEANSLFKSSSGSESQNKIFD